MVPGNSIDNLPKLPPPKGELRSLFQIQELKTSQLRRCSWGKLRGSASPRAPELHFSSLLLCLIQGLCLPKTAQAAPAAICPLWDEPGLWEEGEGRGGMEQLRRKAELSVFVLQPKATSEGTARRVSFPKHTGKRSQFWEFQPPESLGHGGHSPRPLTLFMSTSSCKTPKTSPLQLLHVSSNWKQSACPVTTQDQNTP